jgi:hypothetical protein
MTAIGWQGGTVHDLCDHLQLDVYEFLYMSPAVTHTGSDYNKGLYWYTNDPDHQKFLQTKYRGNCNYWLGVARAVELKEG